MNNVCWIEGVTNFVVEAGNYIPVWRFKILENARGI